MTQFIIKDLISLLKQISNQDYSNPLPVLFNSSIGNHVRHSIEMYECLLNGYDTNAICYDNRKRNPVIETNISTAIECLEIIELSINRTDKTLLLTSMNNAVQSSYFRELLYCDEHLIHHMTLIKIAVHHLGGYQLDDNFGVAPSTIQHREQCAQ